MFSRTLLTSLFFSTLLYARTVTFDFTDLTYFDAASTAVWNLTSHSLHTPFIIDRTDTLVDLTETEDDALPIGTGRHGEFSTSTFASLDVNGGADPHTVTLDTSTVWEFTTFSLPAGYTLRGQGTDGLQIRIQGSATIGGLIDLRGQDGTDASTTVTDSPAGGTGTCGGKSGGTGGNSTTSATAGTGAGTAGVGGGNGGTPSALATKKSGYGGGGGYEAAPFQSQNGLTEAGGGAGGTGGTSYGDEFISTLYGGSGGGGGAAYTLGGTNGAGAGGGSGGGAIKITLGGNFRVVSGGQILATGGNGGDPVGGSLSGGGGGGAGGTIAVYAGGALENSGTINASYGTGGGTVGPATDGNGASGRTRLVCNDTQYGGVGGTENPVPNMPGSVSNSFGQSFHTLSATTIQSKSFDTGNSSPSYTSVDVVQSLPSGSTAVYRFSGSSDNFQSDATSYVDRSQIASLNGKRYFKFQVILTSGTRTVTPEVTSIAVNFDEHTQSLFTFGSSVGCASVRQRNNEPSSPWLTLLGFLFLVSIPRMGRITIQFREKLRVKH